MWYNKKIVHNVDNYVDKLEVMHKLWISIVDKMWITFDSHEPNIENIKPFYYPIYLTCKDVS